MLTEPSLYSIKSILILDSDGKRIVAKYYDSSFSSVKEQLEFESKLFKKTSKSSGAEITLLDGATCVYRNVSDVYLYVIGDVMENELILVSALNCLYESISQILKRCVEKKTVLDNLDLIFLAVDELCNSGQVPPFHFTYDRLQNPNGVRLYRLGGPSHSKCKGANQAFIDEITVN
ncbi:hypothetical protein EG68_04590 [Paragonimus skrjabini miyazakii]|uniref:Coatomer subunit zeta n=1 Tax=Paragonimus skrjabini miyazakii TaxID=59628 RepID=A0A8S9YM74_9TREM|nr:hypothetical protein EG68_04590 [Paragonimus skrjabini miyazakii]